MGFECRIGIIGHPATPNDEVMNLEHLGEPEWRRISLAQKHGRKTLAHFGIPMIAEGFFGGSDEVNIALVRAYQQAPGSDLGADNPEEIAPTIVAEIHAWSAGRADRSLGLHEGPIH